LLNIQAGKILTLFSCRFLEESLKKAKKKAGKTQPSKAKMLLCPSSFALK
jgi:hypothetical protein